MDQDDDSCPCHSGLPYDECCQPYHDGANAPGILLLMRSRYAAYALNLPDYIIATTHPDSPQFQEDKAAWRKSIVKFCKGTVFSDLKILDFEQKDTTGTVTFTAYLMQGKKDASFTERSYFIKKDNRWLYFSAAG